MRARIQSVFTSNSCRSTKCTGELFFLLKSNENFIEEKKIKFMRKIIVGEHKFDSNILSNTQVYCNSIMLLCWLERERLFFEKL